MARKHCAKHNRGNSNYKQRLADRGLSRTPTMRFTGMTTSEIQAAFAKLPHYKWKWVQQTDLDGRVLGHVQVRTLIQ